MLWSQPCIMPDMGVPGRGRGRLGWWVSNCNVPQTTWTEVHITSIYISINQTMAHFKISNRGVSKIMHAGWKLDTLGKTEQHHMSVVEIQWTRNIASQIKSPWQLARWKIFIKTQNSRWEHFCYSNPSKQMARLLSNAWVLLCFPVQLSCIDVCSLLGQTHWGKAQPQSH